MHVIGINLTCHSNHHSVNHLSTTQHFHLNNNFLLARQIPFCNLYHDPPSAYNPMSSMQYYQPTMSSQVSANQSDDNEIEGTNNNHKDDHEDNEEDDHVAQLLIDDNFSYISIF